MEKTNYEERATLLNKVASTFRLRKEGLSELITKRNG
jgi:acyl-CoA reductase-like NAD-dependent aldehyde dehydrogenase